MKKILGILLALTMLLSLTACMHSWPTSTDPNTDVAVDGTQSVVDQTEPSDTADEIPTEDDGTQPSTVPATDPTIAPTTEPTTAPTTAPTTEPSTEATTQPTVEPTIEPTESPTEPTSEPTTPPTEPQVQKGFKIHFIDVGQADAALVICDGKTMLIDGGNAADSNLMYTYLKKHNITHLDYVIGTHAHEDHIGGIAGALNFATVGKAYCPSTSYSTKAFRNFVSALAKHGVSITVPTKGMTFSLGSASCTILAVNTDKGDLNNTSIVMRIVYGNTSFLFTGDAEREVEQAILNSGKTIKSTVLKVGHHGSSSSTSYVWLRAVMPEYAVIPVGKGNTYGHPTEAVLSRLRDAEVKTFRTDMQGDIICMSNGAKVTFTVSHNANADVFEGLGGNSTQPTDPPVTEPTLMPTEPEVTESETTLPTESAPTELPPTESEPTESDTTETETTEE